MNLEIKPMEITEDMTIDQIADTVHANARGKGFHDRPVDVFLAEQANNLHAEVSELWDAYRAGKLYDLCDKADGMEKLGLPPLTCIEEEYADLIIRALDQCRRLGVPIARAIAIKHQYNLSRPHMHGKKN